MTYRTFASYLLSLLVVLVFAASGVYAFHGSPFGANDNRETFERPQWSREIENRLGFPVYRLKDNGSSLAVGRLMMQGPEHLEVTVFPDVNLEPVGRSQVILMETNARALWALVPTDSRIKITKEMERVASSMRNRFVSIVRNPAFDDTYRARLQDIIADAYERLRKDPSLDMATDRAIEIYRREYSDAVTDSLMLIALPRLRGAVLEMMTPTWNSMLDLVTAGKVDFTPLGDAATDLLRDDEFFDALVRHALNISRDQRFWRLGVLLADAFIDEVSADPRTEKLVDDISRDPAFTTELQVLEREASAATTRIFSYVVGRGPDLKPDSLAVRVIRYIILRRPRLVAVIVPSGETPPPGLLGRYVPLTRMPL